MSEIKVNKISPRTACGTTTLGDSGDTFTIPAGVTITNNGTQTGFGRTGTVNWDTSSIKTGDFTAVSGNGYFVNSTSGAIAVTLPASPSAGDIVAIADYAGTAASNNITINRNSSKFEGSTNNGTISTNRQTATLIYADVTQGWVVVNSNDASFQSPEYVAATGGTITTVCTNYKVHTFTGPGCFQVTNAGNSVGSNTVDYLVIAGGGGGGRGCSHGAGGGAGGYRFSNGTASGCYAAGPTPLGASALPVSVSTYPITVGGGGAGSAASPSPKVGANGSNSIFSSITSTGGGGGAGWSNTGGNPGGSGGGSACNPSPGNVGNGNTPPVSPPQGNNGGPASGARMGGGGGIGEAGNTDGQGHGGDGLANSINGTPTTRGGGGSGGGSSCSSANIAGGDGGGGTGSGSGNGGAGTANTGGGAGGSYNTSDTGGAGGSGVVIIRYKFQ